MNSVFYENSGATFAAPGKTSPTHDFIALLHKKGKLLTNYTQNIDNIEASAGVPPENLIQCHGSWANATCLQCGHKVPGEEILGAVRAKRVAYCRLCPEGITEQANLRKRKRMTDDHRGSAKNRRRSYDDDSSDNGQYDIPQPGVMKVRQDNSSNIASANDLSQTSPSFMNSYQTISSTDSTGRRVKTDK